MALTQTEVCGEEGQCPSLGVRVGIGGRGVREARHPGHMTQVLKPHGHIDWFVCF